MERRWNLKAIRVSGNAPEAKPQSQVFGLSQEKLG